VGEAPLARAVAREKNMLKKGKKLRNSLKLVGLLAKKDPSGEGL
jgi:hypothetical protein